MKDLQRHTGRSSSRRPERHVCFGSELVSESSALASCFDENITIIPYHNMDSSIFVAGKNMHLSSKLATDHVLLSAGSSAPSVTGAGGLSRTLSNHHTKNAGRADAHKKVLVVLGICLTTNPSDL